jgi:hypothetical protein
MTQCSNKLTRTLPFEYQKLFVSLNGFFQLYFTKRRINSNNILLIHCLSSAYQHCLHTVDGTIHVDCFVRLIIALYQKKSNNSHSYLNMMCNMK